MSEGTRRVFLTRSGIGVAAAGVAAVTATAVLSPTPPGESAGAPPELPDISGSLVAFVRDVRAAEVSVMVGETEIVLQDRDLVTQLLRATAR